MVDDIDSVAAMRRAELAYLLLLNTIQPARIQDIARMAPKILPHEYAEVLAGDMAEMVHALMRKRGMVISVRRGVYCISRTGGELLRKMELQRAVANGRFFLMKSERKRLKCS